MRYVDEVLQKVIAQNPAQPEFHQAVQEVLETLSPIIEKNEALYRREALLERLIERMGLSARACSRMIRLARTIADLASAPDILPEHLSEAAAYRFLDRQNIL